MSDFLDEPSTKLPNLWRAKLQAYFWTLAFAVLFFVVFFSVRYNLPTPTWNVLAPAEWTMTIVMVCVVACTFAFNKVYMTLNSEAETSNTKMLRQLLANDEKKMRLAKEDHQQLEHIYNLLVTEPELLESKK